MATTKTGEHKPVITREEVYRNYGLVSDRIVGPRVSLFDVSLVILIAASIVLSGQSGQDYVSSVVIGLGALILYAVRTLRR